jgi:hypothetical protein
MFVGLTDERLDQQALHPMEKVKILQVGLQSPTCRPPQRSFVRIHRGSECWASFVSANLRGCLPHECVQAEPGPCFFPLFAVHGWASWGRDNSSLQQAPSNRGVPRSSIIKTPEALVMLVFIP